RGPAGGGAHPPRPLRGVPAYRTPGGRSGPRGRGRGAGPAWSSSAEALGQRSRLGSRLDALRVEPELGRDRNPLRGVAKCRAPPPARPAVVPGAADVVLAGQDAPDRGGLPAAAARGPHSLRVEPAGDRADRRAVKEPREDAPDDRRVVGHDRIPPDPLRIAPVAEGGRPPRDEPAPRLFPPAPGPALL